MTCHQIDINQIAKSLKELGHPTRLAIFKRVIKAGYQGIAVGDIQQQLAIPGSTLSHHISSLASAGLLKYVYNNIRNDNQYLTNVWFSCR
jgi:DNA-binding transcriptional ArsR family regulator